MTNVEKQERYRKKENLKKIAGEIAIRFSTRVYSPQNFAQGKNPSEFKRKLEAAIDLPPNWTDEDYNNALKSLENLSLEFFDNPHLLNNDIVENHESIEAFLTTQNPTKYTLSIKKAQSDSIKLANHILSAIELSELSTADASAAVLDVLRTLGRILIDSKKIPESNATAWALATIGHQYKKPDFFYRRFTKALCNQIGTDGIKILEDLLSEFKI